MSDFGSNMGKLVDSVAIRAYKRSKPVTSLDTQLTELQAEVVIIRSDLLDAQLAVDTLQSEMLTAQSAITMLQNNYNALLSSFNTHVHNYQDATISDTADGTGTLTETTKTTSTKV